MKASESAGTWPGLLLKVAVLVTLLGGAFLPALSRAMQLLVLVALLGAIGWTGWRVARRLLPDFGTASLWVAAFTIASACAVLVVTVLGHFGQLRPAPFLLCIGALFAVSSFLGAPPRATQQLPLNRLDFEAALLLTAALAIALSGAGEIARTKYRPAGFGPDDLSYHLPAVATWSQYGDLRMIKFPVGDRSTTFYPIVGEISSWVLLAPFRDSDFAARWSQLPFALFSFLAVAAIGLRLGLAGRSAAFAAILYASIHRVFPILALSAGNDHSAAFFTLAALDGVLATARRPAAGNAIYSGLALGLLAGTKYIGVVFAATVLGVLLLGLVADRIPWRKTLSLASMAAAAAVLTGGYVYVRNLVVAGNPLFPAPVRILGREVLPGWQEVTLAFRRSLPEFHIDLVSFLLRRRDLLGPFFPATLLPAAILAPAVALIRRQRLEWIAVLTLPLVFFLEFLFVMHDHRDMRYFMAGLALAAIAFSWLVQPIARWGIWLRSVLCALIAYHAVRRLGLASWAEVAATVLLAILAYGILRLRSRDFGRWALAAAVLVIAISISLALGDTVEKYQRVKLDDQYAASALERIAGKGANVSYVGLNRPYHYFGSRLQNRVQILPTGVPVAAQYFEWRGTAEFPFDDPHYEKWRRFLKLRKIRFVVVDRSPWENPERYWLVHHPGQFRLLYEDSWTEIWECPVSRPRRTGKGEGLFKGGSDAEGLSLAVAGFHPRRSR